MTIGAGQVHYGGRREQDLGGDCGRPMREDFLPQEAEKNPRNYNCTSKYFVLKVIIKQHYLSIRFSKSGDKTIAPCQEFIGSFWIYIMRSDLTPKDSLLQEAGRELKWFSKSLALPS